MITVTPTATATLIPLQAPSELSWIPNTFSWKKVPYAPNALNYAPWFVGGATQAEGDAVIPKTIQIPGATPVGLGEIECDGNPDGKCLIRWDTIRHNTTLYVQACESTVKNSGGRLVCKANPETYQSSAVATLDVTTDMLESRPVASPECRGNNVHLVSRTTEIHYLEESEPKMDLFRLGAVPLRQSIHQK